MGLCAARRCVRASPEVPEARRSGFGRGAGPQSSAWGALHTITHAVTVLGPIQRAARRRTPCAERSRLSKAVTGLMEQGARRGTTSATGGELFRSLQFHPVRQLALRKRTRSTVGDMWWARTGGRRPTERIDRRTCQHGAQHDTNCSGSLLTMHGWWHAACRQKITGFSEATGARTLGNVVARHGSTHVWCARASIPAAVKSGASGGLPKASRGGGKQRREPWGRTRRWS